MALLTCNECNGKVSDKAASCPHCGAPVVVPQMTVCEECEETFPSSAPTCPHCGYPNEAAASAPAPQVAPPVRTPQPSQTPAANPLADELFHLIHKPNTPEFTKRTQLKAAFNKIQKLGSAPMLGGEKKEKWKAADAKRKRQIEAMIHSSSPTDPVFAALNPAQTRLLITKLKSEQKSALIGGGIAVVVIGFIIVKAMSGGGSGTDAGGEKSSSIKKMIANNIPSGTVDSLEKANECVTGTWEYKNSQSQDMKFQVNADGSYSFLIFSKGDFFEHHTGTWTMEKGYYSNTQEPYFGPKFVSSTKFLDVTKLKQHPELASLGNLCGEPVKGMGGCVSSISKCNQMKTVISSLLLESVDVHFRKQ